jgi:hypothetical protein
MEQLRVISADSHMMEPADLWVERLDEQYRERAPKVVPNPKGSGQVFVVEGMKPFPVAGGCHSELKRSEGEGFRHTSCHT